MIALLKLQFLPLLCFINLALFAIIMFFPATPPPRDWEKWVYSKSRIAKWLYKKTKNDVVFNIRIDNFRLVSFYFHLFTLFVSATIVIIDAFIGGRISDLLTPKSICIIYFVLLGFGASYEMFLILFFRYYYRGKNTHQTNHLYAKKDIKQKTRNKKN